LTPGLIVSHPKSSYAQKLNEKQSGEGFHVGFTLKRKVTAGASKSPLKFTIELNIVGCFPGLFSGLLCSEKFEVLLPLCFQIGFPFESIKIRSKLQISRRILIGSKHATPIGVSNAPSPRMNIISKSPQFTIYTSVLFRESRPASGELFDCD
jgi:hypothetical protein